MAESKDQDVDAFDLEAQDKARQEQNLAIKRRAKEDSDDWKWLMGQKRGRRMVWRMLERAGVFRSSFDPDSLQMAFNEGARNEGLHTVNAIMSNCPEHWTTMSRENS